MRGLFQRVKLDAVGFDRALAVVLLVALYLETWLGGNAEGHRVSVSIGGTLIVAGVAVRRRYPFAVGIGAALLSVLMQTAWPSQEVTWAIGWMCDMYALAVWTRPRQFAVGLGAYVVTALGAALLPIRTDSVEENLKGTVPFIVVSSAVMVIVRQVVGTHARRARIAERERDVAAREAVVEERARIARELHDVIAHNVSMMVVQAGAERRVLGEENESTRDVLATVEEIGRSALTEMRRLVGMLRSDTDNPLEPPQPGLDDLGLLVRQVREAGLPVELHVDGERRGLPAGVELSAYRIVQEALTNTLKHAGNASAEVHVRYGPDALDLEIVDNGTGSTARVSGGGHGLLGMRERVALYGGHLDAGHRPSGGYSVHVLLPIR